MSYYVLGRASFFVANTNSDANKSRTGLSQYLFEHRSHIFPSTIRTSWVGEKFYTIGLILKMVPECEILKKKCFDIYIYNIIIFIR